MAKKPSVDEALEAWREAEEKYRKAVDGFLDDKKKSPKAGKDDAVTITKARTKADRRMATYFETCLR
jgi:hypothetical protein